MQPVSVSWYFTGGTHTLGTSFQAGSELFHLRDCKWNENEMNFCCRNFEIEILKFLVNLKIESKSLFQTPWTQMIKLAYE